MASMMLLILGGTFDMARFRSRMRFLRTLGRRKRVVRDALSLNVVSVIVMRHSWRRIVGRERNVYVFLRSNGKHW